MDVVYLTACSGKNDDVPNSRFPKLAESFVPLFDELVICDMFVYSAKHGNSWLRFIFLFLSLLSPGSLRRPVLIQGNTAFEACWASPMWLELARRSDLFMTGSIAHVKVCTIFTFHHSSRFYKDKEGPALAAYRTRIDLARFVASGNSPYKFEVRKQTLISFPKYLCDFAA